MTFDCSRFPFDPWKDYLGVVKQQGRVDLDSDWNEFQAEIARRVQAGTMDAFGRAVVPATTPYGFKIAAYTDATGRHVAIGAGRMYVDGLLIENHGTSAAASWDPSLAELSCAPFGGAEVMVDYTRQIYLPGATLPAGDGPFLAYVDVWRRPVTYLDDPDLLEAAVGVDTTGRLQTVWQVRLLDVSAVSATIAGGVTCSTPDAEIPHWVKLNRPSAGLLTTNIVPSPSTGLCSLAPPAGYAGLENQLYRVQIHQGGAANANGAVANPSATFKWSRDNASVATAVTAIGAATNSLNQPSSVLTVQSTGRDTVLGFTPGRWIEITDDYTELHGQSGELHLIDVNGVNNTSRTITLATPVSAGFATRLNDPNVNYHTRICRWDQSGQVLLSDNKTLWVDLTLAGSSGLIPVPPSGLALILEGGITVAFDLASSTGSFLPCDYWTFAARTATGSVDLLAKAPPRGVHHHYARLATVTFPGAAGDCRRLWPPPARPCCGCTVCIGPGDLTANLPLQSVVDNYKNQPGPNVICLKPGTYQLMSPLRLGSAHANIALKACQPGTALLQAKPGQESEFGDGLVVLDDAANTALIGLGFVAPLAPFAATRFAGLPLTSFDPDVQSLLGSLSVSIAVRAFNCSGLTIEKCAFDLTPLQNASAGATPFGVGVFAGGRCAGWRLEGNAFNGAGDFAAGFLIAASVDFNPPIPGGVRPQPRIGLLSQGSAFDRFNSIFTQGTSSIGLAAQGGKVVPGTLSGATFRSNVFSNLTIAVLSVAGTAAVSAGTGAVQFLGNTVTNCTAGVWLLSPLQAAALANVPLNLTVVVGLSVALGYPVPLGDATPPVAIAAAPSSVRICTATAAIKDSAGNVWTPDAETAGVKVNGGGLSEVSSAISPSAVNQALYQNERWGLSFSYTFTGLPTGYYQVTLKFAELFHNSTGARAFNVSINGVQVLSDFDIFADVARQHPGSGEFYADDKVYGGIAVSNGQIVIEFTGSGTTQDNNAKVDAVEIDPEWSTAFANPSSLQGGVGATRITELQNFFAQIMALGKQSFASLTQLPRQIRITDNEMQGLTSPAALVFGDDTVQNNIASSLFMTGNRLSSQAILPTTTDQIPGQVQSGPLPIIFYWLAVSTVADFEVCLVSGNIMTLEATPPTGTSLYRFAFLMDNSALPRPAVSVMSNTFGGGMYVTPDRPAPYSALPYPTGQWSYLNATP